jgi:hypothetical protein
MTMISGPIVPTGVTVSVLMLVIMLVAPSRSCAASASSASCPASSTLIARLHRRGCGPQPLAPRGPVSFGTLTIA